MKQHSHEHSARAMKELLGISRSGYYRWRKNPQCARSRRDGELGEEILRIYEKSHGIYGSPRIHGDLQDRGVRIARKRVARLMREQRIRGVCRRRRKPRTTNSDHANPIAPTVAKEMRPQAIDELWVSDLPYVRTQGGWAYLACVMDAYSRRIVGWSVKEHMKSDLVIEALDQALKRRRPPVGLIHHSDRGCQYASQQYRQALSEGHIRASMSRRANPYDNAKMESFFATLKSESLDRTTLFDVEDVRAKVFAYVEGFYNSSRRHTSLGGKSPKSFEETANFSSPSGEENSRPTASLLENQDQQSKLN